MSPGEVILRSSDGDDILVVLIRPKFVEVSTGTPFKNNELEESNLCPNPSTRLILLSTPSGVASFFFYFFFDFDSKTV